MMILNDNVNYHLIIDLNMLSSIIHDKFLIIYLCTLCRSCISTVLMVTGTLIGSCRPVARTIGHDKQF